MADEPIVQYVMTDHAVFEMRRRGISEQDVRQVLSSPEQRFAMRPNRVVVQSRVEMGTPAIMYLIRVIVDTDRNPAAVVTVYRTSKIAKYWREAP